MPADHSLVAISAPPPEWRFSSFLRSSMAPAHTRVFYPRNLALFTKDGISLPTIVLLAWIPAQHETAAWKPPCRVQYQGSGVKTPYHAPLPCKFTGMYCPLPVSRLPSEIHSKRGCAQHLHIIDRRKEEKSHSRAPADIATKEWSAGKSDWRSVIARVFWV